MWQGWGRVHACTHLNDISQCSGVTDVAGLGQCASLHDIVLSLTGCSGVPDVAALGQHTSLHPQSPHQ